MKQKLSSIELKYDATPPTIRNVDFGYQVYPGRSDMSKLVGDTIEINNYVRELGNVKE